MKPIDGDALIRKAEHEAEGMPEPFKSNFATLVEWLVGKTPTIDPDQKKGRWIANSTSYADGVRQTMNCSVCGRRSPRPLGDFCRWCGVDMREENG